MRSKFRNKSPRVRRALALVCSLLKTFPSRVFEERWELRMGTKNLRRKQ
jgi:hypothetical protein